MSGRIEAYLNGLREAFEGSALFEDVRVHLDPYEIEDVTKESFKAPAARIVFAIGNTEPEAEGGLSLRLRWIVAIITRREGRADPSFLSADAKSLDLARAAAQLITDDAYFGQVQATAAEIKALKVALSELSSKHGLAITLLECEARLLRWVTTRDPIAELFSATRPTVPPTLVINGEEQP